LLWLGWEREAGSAICFHLFPLPVKNHSTAYLEWSELMLVLVGEEATPSAAGREAEWGMCPVAAGGISVSHVEGELAAVLLLAPRVKIRLAAICSTRFGTQGGRHWDDGGGG